MIIETENHQSATGTRKIANVNATATKKVQTEIETATRTMTSDENIVNAKTRIPKRKTANEIGKITAVAQRKRTETVRMIPLVSTLDHAAKSILINPPRGVLVG